MSTATARGPVMQTAAAVAAHYTIPLPVLLGESMARHVVLARHTAMALAHEVLGRSCSSIGRAMQRDRTGVMHGVRRAAALRQSDPVYAAQFDALAEILAASQPPMKEA